jgi:hypothetical protein
MQRSTFSILRTGLSAGVVACGLWGCGEPAPSQLAEETVPAAGVVTYKGQALENYRVSFVAEGRRAASAISDAQGKFVLGTDAPGDGAPAGQHKVAVAYVGPQILEGDAADAPPPPPPKVKIPVKFGNIETSGVTVTIPAEGSQDLKVELN